MNNQFCTKSYSRREFLQNSAVTGVALSLGRDVLAAPLKGQSLKPMNILGGLRREAGPAPLSQATWYVAQASEDGLLYRLSPGTLTDVAYLTFDMLLDGQHMTTFRITLQEGEKGPSFSFRWGCLNQCSLRVRFSTQSGCGAAVGQTYIQTPVHDKTVRTGGSKVGPRLFTLLGKSGQVTPVVPPGDTSKIQAEISAHRHFLSGPPPL